jgi:hypothetical protein
LCIVYALLGTYLLRRWDIWFYIKSTRFDVEFRFDACHWTTSLLSEVLEWVVAEAGGTLSLVSSSRWQGVIIPRHTYK